ncbi:MAG: alpha/beta fold hydrolase [Opitutales bacterium]
MNCLIWILSIAFTVYLVLSLFILFFGEKLAYPAPDSSYKEGEIREQFFIDGKVSALYFDRDVDYTVLFSHGNGEDIGEIYERVEHIANQGFNLLCYDYFGYGLTKGTPSEKGVYESANIAFNYLVNVKKVPANKIIIMGFSMGSSASNYLASTHKDVAKLVLIGGFSSALESIFKYNIFPFDFLKNKEKIGKVECDTLFIHGTKDRIVRYFNARKMYALCKAPKKLITIDGAGHNDIFDYKELWTGIREIL